MSIGQGIRLGTELRIDESELRWRFIRAAGPGGQNVNRVATAVQLRFHVSESPSLSAELKSRVLALAGHRATLDGEVVIEARRFRSQALNRADARRRLEALLRSALSRPRPRRLTRRPAASARRRLEEKRHRSAVKRLRRRPPEI